LARIEQNASLRRQEQIAETNSFRNTVLGALPLIDPKDKNDYIITQISTRLSGFENNLFKIDKLNFFELFQLKQLINFSNDDLKKTSEFVEFISIENKIDETLKKQGIRDSTKETFLKWHKIKTFIGLPWIFFLILGLQVKNGAKFELNPIILIAALLLVIICAHFLNVIKNNSLKAFDEVDNLRLKSAEIKKTINALFLSILKQRIEFKSFFNLNSNDIAKLYFNSVFLDQIETEQSFLPSQFRPTNEDWFQFFIKSSAISQIENLKEQIDTMIMNTIVIDINGASSD
jgi:hypothetical protein